MRLFVMRWVSSERLFVMRWVSRKGLHDTKKFLFGWTALHLKVPHKVGLHGDEKFLRCLLRCCYFEWNMVVRGVIKRFLSTEMWEFVIILVITGARALQPWY